VRPWAADITGVTRQGLQIFVTIAFIDAISHKHFPCSEIVNNTRVEWCVERKVFPLGARAGDTSRAVLGPFCMRQAGG
jgi:hypothetical protein